MTLDLRYIPAFSIEDVILDKETGAPLAGGQVFFYKDSQRSVKKPVYQLTGSSPNYSFVQMSNPVILSAIGTFEDAFGNPTIPYFFPYEDDGVTPDLYFIKVLSSGDTPQFNREAQPYVIETQVNPDSLLNTENELSNPQFVEVYFNPQESHTLAVSGGGTFSIAPGWDIVAEGTGSVIIERIELVAVDTPTNPPYALDIQSFGITSLSLVQRLSNSPRLMANGFIAGTFVAESQDGSGHTLTLAYIPSGGSLISNIIAQDTISSSGNYNVIQGNLEIEGVINSEPASIGYVDIALEIPVGAHIRVSSFQIVGVNSTSTVPFGQQTAARQKDHLFHSYMNSILLMPKDSLVTGWNFAQNPFQFYPNALTTATSQCQYIADQTILWSETASSLKTGAAPAANNFALTIQAISGQPNNLFCVIQYIDTNSFIPYWQASNPISILVKAIHTGTSVPKLKARIIYRSDLPPTISATEPIASFIPGGDPIFSAGWTAIKPLNDPQYSLVSDTSQYHEYAFNNFIMPIMPSDTAMVGIVIYSNERLDTIIPDSVYIQNISVVPNEFAIGETPRTFDESLRRCQFYWEKSYDWGIPIGTATNQGQCTIPMLMSTSGNAVFERSFEIIYKQVKRAAPSSINIYPTVSPISVGNVTLSMYGNGVLTSMSVGTNPTNIPLSDWSLSEANTSSAWFISSQSINGVLNFTPTVSNVNYEPVIQFQYSIDCRLGV